MNDNKLKELIDLKAKIEALEEYRVKIVKALDKAKNSNYLLTVSIDATEDKFPYVASDIIRKVINKTGISFNSEIKVLLVLLLEKLDDNLSELREKFENFS